MRLTALRTSDSSEGVAAIAPAGINRLKPEIKSSSKRIVRLLFIRLFRSFRFTGISFRRRDLGAQLTAITQKPRDGAQCSTNESGRQIVSPKKNRGGYQEQRRSDEPDTFHRSLHVHRNRGFQSVRRIALLSVTGLDRQFDRQRPRAFAGVCFRAQRQPDLRFAFVNRQRFLRKLEFLLLPDGIDRLAGYYS